MEPVNLIDELTSSPALYPLAIDLKADMVRLVTLTQAVYEEASFLDRLRLKTVTGGIWLPWAEVRRAAAGLRARCHFIFHISHVGSTLVSRLLGCHPALFSLREPGMLRLFAEQHPTLDQPGCLWSRAEFDDRLGIHLGLWSRTFQSEQTVVFKATSFASGMSDVLMERVADSRSLLMFVQPERFLQTLLRGSMNDITSTSAKRLLRLGQRLGAAPWRIEDLSPGESVAMCWLSEMLALHTTSARFPSRVLWMDFDHFLASPGAGLIAAFRQFGVHIGEGEAEKILSSAAMRQYSKNPSREYDAQERSRLLQQAAQDHAVEIQKGMKWLERAAAEFPVVQEVITAAAGRAASPQKI